MTELYAMVSAMRWGEGFTAHMVSYDVPTKAKRMALSVDSSRQTVTILPRSYAVHKTHADESNHNSIIVDRACLQ